jgi:hypothetical protein
MGQLLIFLFVIFLPLSASAGNTSVDAYCKSLDTSSCEVLKIEHLTTSVVGGASGTVILHEHSFVTYCKNREIKVARKVSSCTSTAGFECNTSSYQLYSIVDCATLP